MIVSNVVFQIFRWKRKNKASRLICGQKYDSHFTALLALKISYQIRISLFLFIYFFFYEVNNLFIYVQNFKFLSLFIIVYLLVRMRFHLNTLFEILIRIALWSIIRCKLWDILTFKTNILQMKFSFMSQHIHTHKRSWSTFI